MFLPIINAQSVEIKEISKEILKKHTTLEILYFYLDCSRVEKVPFNESFDFIIDEEGMLKNHKLGYSLPHYPNDFKENVFFGNSTLVKNVEDENGEISWTFFDNYEELVDILRKYFQEQKVYKRNIESHLL